MQRVTACASLPEAVAGADLVIEAVSEDLALKQRVFAELDRACGAEVVLASNTSTFMPSALAAGARHPERILVAHYFNPPTPVAGGGDRAAPRHRRWRGGARVQLVRRPRQALRWCCSREIAGFIANRLQQALLREAAALVEAGVASTADVDAVVSGSFGRRLAVAGPFEVSDLAGLDVIAAIARELWPDLAAGGVADLLAAPAAAGDYGAKSGRGFGNWPLARTAAAKQRIAAALAAIAALPGTEP